MSADAGGKTVRPALPGRVAAVIPAAGQGKRMGGGTVKQFLPLKGKPILAHTLDVFEAASAITEVVLVVSEDYVAACQKDIVQRYRLKKVRRIVVGGAERQHSVYNGLLALDKSVDLVVVHDAARPLITPDLLNWAVSEAWERGSVVMAVPVKDTIKVVGATGLIHDTPERRRLWAAQTPQIFPYGVLLGAYEKARREAFVGTDDASLVERLGQAVHVIEGSPENMKITTPEDLLLAEMILERR